MFGTIRRLKMALRLARLSYTPSKLTIVPIKSMPTVRAVLITFDNAVLNSGDSFRLPGAVTNGEMILQLRSQKATTLGSDNDSCKI